MPLFEKYCITGIIFDARDIVTKQPRKRVVVQFPNSVTTKGIDIPATTKDNPGHLKQAACNALGISMAEVYISDNLKRIIMES